MFSLLPFCSLVLPLSTFSFRIEGLRSAVSSSPTTVRGQSPAENAGYVYCLKGPLLSCDNSFIQRRLTRLIYYSKNLLEGDGASTHEQCTSGSGKLFLYAPYTADNFHVDMNDVFSAISSSSDELSTLS